MFIDQEKEYLTTRKYIMMKELPNLGLINRLLTFINNFFTDRNFSTANKINPAIFPQSR